MVSDDAREVHFGLKLHTTGAQTTFTVISIAGAAAPAVLVK